MSDYRPKARRPIADLFRSTANLAVRLCVTLGIHPDAVSLASILASAGAGVCFWRSGGITVLLLPAAFLCVVRLWLNMLDGMVALASGKASARGEVFNEVPDRVSDVLIFVGVAHSGHAHLLAGYWAAIASLLTAYVGIMGQAVGARREFGGIMSKPWRMAALIVGACAAWLDLQFPPPTTIGGLSILDLACLLVVGGCVQSIWIRLHRTLRYLSPPADEAGERQDAAKKNDATEKRDGASEN